MIWGYLIESKGIWYDEYHREALEMLEGTAVFHFSLGQGLLIASLF